MKDYIRTFTARPDDIDELGHVNNAVWVRWIQTLATDHWQAAATPEQVAAFVWVVIRHEIDYLGNLRDGESVTARTWVADAPVGAKFDRFVEFTKDGRVIVRARTTWAVLNRATGRLVRVPKDVPARFTNCGSQSHDSELDHSKSGSQR